MNPAALLAPANGTDARYVLQSKLNWLSSELHGRIGPLFGPSEPAIKDFLLARFNKTLTYLNDVELNGKKSFLVGNNFTIADSYCYIILTWTPYLGISFAHLPNVVSFFEGIKALDFVQAAHAEMNAKCSAAGYKF